MVIDGYKMVNSGLNGFLAVLTLLQHLITSNHLHFMILTQHSSSSVRHQNHKHNDVNKMTLNDRGSNRGPSKDLGLPRLSSSPPTAQLLVLVVAHGLRISLRISLIKDRPRTTRRRTPDSK